MIKAYWMAHMRVTDPDAYARYREANAAAFRKYGGRFLARGGEALQAEGASDRDRHVIIEFPSMEAARECYESEEYRAARAHRHGASEGEIFIVEGYDGPQPTD